MCIPLVAHAQSTGVVAGTVLGTPEAVPLADVRISVAGSARAAVTDRVGHYRLEGLTPGEYVLNATLLGREPARRTVRVSAGGTTAADFTLAQGSALLSGVVV